MPPACRLPSRQPAPKELGLKYEPDQFTTIFWDRLGEQGHPVRATIPEMGPLRRWRACSISSTTPRKACSTSPSASPTSRSSCCSTSTDLRAISPSSRRERAGLDHPNTATSARRRSARNPARAAGARKPEGRPFGEPALDIGDLLTTDRDGRGIVNILAADKLMNNPRLYATFLLWLLSSCSSSFPRSGSRQAETRLLRRGASALQRRAPKALLTAVEQVVRLIRSKGVGVYFVTAEPARHPAIRRAGPARQPRPARAARLHPARPEGGARRRRDLPPEPENQAPRRRSAQLAVGEALVSTLEAQGHSSSMVERACIAPPMAQVGPLLAAAATAGDNASACE